MRCDNEKIDCVLKNKGISCLFFKCYHPVLFNAVEKYCAVTRRWSPAPDMYAPRSNFAAAVLDRMIFVVGGFNGEPILYFSSGKKMCIITIRES